MLSACEAQLLTGPCELLTAEAWQARIAKARSKVKEAQTSLRMAKADIVKGDAARTVEPLERAIEDKADLLRMASVLSLGPHDGVMLSVFSDY